MGTRDEPGSAAEPGGAFRNRADLAGLVTTTYDDLRGLARALVKRLGHARPAEATSVVHEAYARLAGAGDPFCSSTAEFLRVASRAMRFVLVDRARREITGKRKGDGTPFTLEEHAARDVEVTPDVLAIHEALDELSAIDRMKVDIVELRFFGGLSTEETAAVLRTSPATIKREWSLAKAWLFRALSRTA